MPTPQTTPRATVEQAAQHTLLIRYDRQTIALPMSEAGQLARALREHVYATAPELRRVTGWDDGTQAVTVAPEQLAAMLAEDWDGHVVHGLACPHPDCDHIAWDDHDDDDGVLIVDEDERWSGATYRRDQVPELAPYDETDPTRRRRPTGRQVLAETLHTGGADTNYEGLGYRCPACHTAR